MMRVVGQVVETDLWQQGLQHQQQQKEKQLFGVLPLALAQKTENMNKERFANQQCLGLKGIYPIYMKN